MRVIESQPDNIMDSTIKLGLIVSFLIHLIFAILMSRHYKVAEPQQQLFDVSIVPEPQQMISDPQSQIIENPQNENPSETPVDSKLSADENFQTEKEQIKRGDRIEAAPVIAKSQPAKNASPAKPQQQQKKQEQAQPEPKKPTQEIQKQTSDVPGKLGDLRLDQQTLMDKFSNSKPAKPSQNEPPASYQAFSRPAGSGAAFIGLNGSSDFLPNLPDGDITLLNAKADKFAVFVRRVASAVFSHIRSTGWETMRAGDLNNISDYCTIHAVLNEKGDLIKITIEGPSGSPRFDETIKIAVKSGANDPNPPKAAMAEDGKFHFIFKSKSWAATGHAKTGAPFERRWLLLATGLL